MPNKILAAEYRTTLPAERIIAAELEHTRELIEQRRCLAPKGTKRVAGAPPEDEGRRLRIAFRQPPAAVGSYLGMYLMSLPVLKPFLAKRRRPALDPEVLRRCTRQDLLAFRIFVGTYQDEVFSLLSRMIWHRTDIEDLAQEVFLKVFKAIAKAVMLSPALTAAGA